MHNIKSFGFGCLSLSVSDIGGAVMALSPFAWEETMSLQLTGLMLRIDEESRACKVNPFDVTTGDFLTRSNQMVVIGWELDDAARAVEGMGV
jgi:hypothetical protein